MRKYWAVVNVAAGPTFADLTIDGTFVPIGPSATGGLGGHRVLESDKDPIPFVFHARGIKGFPVTLGIVLSPLPSGADIKFNPPNYKIPGSGADSGVLTVSSGIPINPAASPAAKKGGND